jgi:alkanesulfonate monooxygenase SsuD/methylene tetrahydromethanopterin reductase-like flavin-dependent oxidoreductase (luciferase family)
VGRDFDSIVRTHGPDCAVFESEAELTQWLDSPGGGHLRGTASHAEYLRDNLVGTAEQVAEKTQEFVDAGCREFVLWFRDAPSSASLERFASDVIPHVAIR